MTLAPPMTSDHTDLKASESEDAFKSQHLESAAKLIIEFGSPLQLQQLIRVENRDQFDQYLCAVDEVQQSIKSGTASSYEPHGIRAIKTLQLLFRGILGCSISATGSDSLNSTVYSSSLSSTSYELQGSNHTSHRELSSEEVYYLRNIVKKLDSTGCLGDCPDVYRISRKSAVDARLLQFHIRNWTANDLQILDSVQFAEKIRMWIQAANICYTNIFPVERQFFEQIFDGVSDVRDDNCFLATVEHVAVELNNFAEAASTIASFAKLFAVLDLYRALCVILPKIQDIFHSVSSISRGAIKTINNLPTLVRKLFSSFENAVLNELSNTPIPEGKIHFLTEYAMIYLTRISLHKELLTHIIVSKPTKSLRNQEDDLFLDASGGTPLELHMIWNIISLKINLERKSELYQDSTSTLRYVFLTTNVNYIIKTITAYPELLKMIGKEYLSKLSYYVAQAAEDYISSIWHRVLHCLRDDGLHYQIPFYNGISRKSVKNRLKAFNTTFEEVCQTQSSMLVPDIHIHCQLHKKMISKLLQAYESFLQKYGMQIQSERYKERYIKYTSEELKFKMLSITEANLALNSFE